MTATTPLILSASRATDIPAFHARWFLQRLEAGYLKWVNPFNRKQQQYISLEQVRAIVFWSKNPRPLMHYLDQVDRRGIGYYFQFTLNDYVAEGLEPNVPSVDQRLDTFRALTDQIGSQRVIWRYDPLLLTRTLTADMLLERIEYIYQKLRGYTHKLVFSFADIASYRKVQNNLLKVLPGFDRDSIADAGFGLQEQQDFVQRLSQLTDTWRQTDPEFALATCAEKVDLARYGIGHNRCIDDELLARLCPDDKALMHFLGHDAGQQSDLFASEGASAKPPKDPKLKDPGQRTACGCILSKDIGSYDTCHHLCSYCYANTSATAVRNNLARLAEGSEALLPS